MNQNHIKANRGKLRYIKLLFALLVLSLGLSWARNVQGPNSRVVSVKKVQEQYYVPVTNYFSDRTDISLKELRDLALSGELLVENGEAQNVLKTLGVESGKDLPVYNPKNKLKEGKIAVLGWSSVTVELRSLRVDGKLLWDKKDYASYPLKGRVESTGSEEFEPEKVTKITALGDVMLSRTVAQKINQKGVLSPWLKTKGRTAGADITFANLEVPLSNNRPAPSSGMSFIAPEKNTEGLRSAGIDVVSVANNHTANFGSAVFSDNLETLKREEIGICGRGKTEADARRPWTIEKNGTKFAFLCYSSITGSLFTEGKGQGVPPLRMAPWFPENKTDLAKMEQDIKKAKEVADVVVVSPHWGVEYKANPNASQRNAARAAIAAGADLVIGTHPHVVQGSELIEGKYITYSLGNFIFDQGWSTETKEGTMLESYFYKGKQVFGALVPLEIKDYHQPNFLEGQKAKGIIDRIKKNSFGF